MNLVDVSEELNPALEGYFKSADSKLVELVLGEINKNTFLDLFENLQWEDLNGKFLILRGNYLYFRPESWGHSHIDGDLIFNREKHISEPAMICDRLKRSYFPFYIDDYLLGKVNRLSLSSQYMRERGKEIKYQVQPNQGFRIVDPIFVFDDIIKDRQDFPELVEFRHLGMLEGAYIPEVGFPSYLN
ncbi:MAG: hypothetical protein KC589_10940 [Nanoarchaeota archaeon]|nr:hypothetical protein [Nanoarchaeota archaeon]